MAQFNGMFLTNRGLALQTKAQTGTPLRFTRIAIGDGYVTDDTELKNLYELVNETLSLPILELKIMEQGKTQAKALISNADLTDGLYVREIGLFANDPDVGEILYCVANAGYTADYLPPDNGKDVVEEIINITTMIGEASDVTAVIEDQAVVTVDTFSDHVNDPTIHITRSEFDAQLASLRNEVNLIKSTFPDNFKNNLFTENFASLASIKLIRGRYNQAATRLEV